MKSVPTQCAQLIDAYLQWLRENYETEAVGERCLISTPLLDRHNDALEIFVKRDGERVILTDAGHTISDLHASGMEFNTPKRKEVLESILNGFGVRREDDELVVTGTVPNCGQKKHNLLQAMLAVDDMFVMSQEHVLSFFKEDVALFLEENSLAHITEFKLSGKSGFDHKFDFGLPRTSKQPERVLQAINRLTRDNTASLAFAASDVRAVRRDPLSCLAFINDESEAPNAEFVDALPAYDIRPLFWGEREQSIPLLNGP